MRTSPQRTHVLIVVVVMHVSVMMDSSAAGEQEYDVQVIAGHDVNQTKPLFSHDVSQVLVASEAEVRIYSTETCAFVRSISCPFASDGRFVSHLFLHPRLPHSHVVYFTNRGEVIIADISTGVVVHTKELFPLVKRDASTTTLRFGQAVSNAQFKKCRPTLTIYFGIAEDCKMYCFDMEDPVQDDLSPKLKKAKFNRNVYNLNVVWHKNNSPAVMLFSPTGTFLTVIQESTLYAQPLPYYKKERTQKVHRICDKTDYTDNITFTCISCHPADETVATGLSDGRIIIWKNLVNEQRPIRVTYHWHRERVTDVCFSAAGSILYSGGLEATLVSYAVSDGSQDFRSKLGIPIKRITCDQANRRIAIQFDDNSLKLISSDLNLDEDVSMTLSELTFDVFSDRVDSVFYEPNSNSLVMKGSPGQLQFFSLVKKKKVLELDVVIKNYDYSELDQITQLVITAFAVSPDGQWIAASELWDDGAHFAEERLKFFARVNHAYELASVFHLPHAKHITGMMFSPDSRTLITTGSDAMFKIWQLKQRRDGEREYWTEMKSCQRNSVWQPSRVCFSADSSIAAVQFDELVTFWSVSSGQLLTNEWMSADHGKDSVVGMGFAGGNKSHMFMQAHKSSITVWNFLHARSECSVQVSNADESFLSVVLEPESWRMICLQSNGNVTIFRNLNPADKVVLTATSKTPSITAWTLVPAVALSEDLKGMEQAFLFFNQDRELIAVKQKSGAAAAAAAESMEVIEGEEEPRGTVPFLGEKLFVGTTASSDDVPVTGKEKKQKMRKIQIVEEFDVDKLADEVFLKHSSQTLPRIDLLCKSFMKHLLLHRMPVQTTKKRKQQSLDENPDLTDLTDLMY